MGGGVAEALAGRGCGVVLTWRTHPEAAEETAASLRKAGGKAAAWRCDVSRDAQVMSLMRKISKGFGRLDILVHLASIYETSGREGSFGRHLDANVRGAYGVSRAAAALMNRAGRIVLISDWTSASGRPRYREYSAYYVSKVAVKGIAEALALELAPRILVNAIAPGPILPPEGIARAEYDAVKKATPLGRWGGVEEIVKAVLFMIETDFVTGETIRVDGGRHLY
jgi:NAD(P)-dependent dehydrogenase (short-subunit alcohol dehydrogenase family)